MNPDFKEMLSVFSEEGAEYLLVGAYALAVYGVPRATGDLDLWLKRSEENARRVWRALARFGAPLGNLDPEDLASAGTVFQIGVSPNRIDLLVTLDGVQFDEAWPERVNVDIEGTRVSVISRRHLIQNKRTVGRPQDLADVARLEETGSSTS